MSMTQKTSSNAAALLLALLLAGCGSGGGGNTGGGGTTVGGGTGTGGGTGGNTGGGSGGGAAAKSTIAGRLIFPGAFPESAPPSGAGQPLLDSSAASWWIDPAQVQARREAAGVQEGGVIPGEFIVRSRVAGGETSESQTLRGQALTAQALGPATLKVGGLSLRRQSSLGLPGLSLYRADLSAAGGLSALAVSSTVQALEARADVLYAEPNRWVHALATPNDEYFPLQWDLSAMNLPAAWNTSTGKNVTVGILDTGIVRHPDLLSRTLPGLDLVSDGKPDTFDTDPTDEGGTSFHGSHVAGSVGAATNNATGIAGVSWGARLLPVRVLGAEGGSTDSVLIGALWAAGADLTSNGLPRNANPARVLNLSLGGPGPCSKSEQDVFDALAQQGVTVVAAAGNENKDAASSSPGNCRNVITVGATGPDGTRAPYSNYGARVDVMAPGGDSSQKIRVGGRELPGAILSTVEDEAKPGRYAYGFLEGTSMAAPHVAGLVALLLGEQPGLTPAQVLAKLKTGSKPLSSAACGVAGGCGAGLVNAAAVLTGTAPAPTPTTPSPSPTPSPVPTPPPPPTPVGTIRTYVAALYQLSSGFDAKRSVIAEVQQTALKSPYQLGGLVEGIYQVAGWQDLNGDEEVSEGEPFGVYVNPLTGKTGVGIDKVGRAIIGLDIDMAPATQSALGGAGQLAALKLSLEQQATGVRR